MGNSEKELLYRLSTIGESFTKKQAIDIAHILPEILFPDEVLNDLIGPWVEKLENNHLNVTPLLINSGQLNIREEVQKSIHRLVVRDLTLSRVINLSTATSVLSHLWQAQEYAEFGRVLVGLLSSIKTKEQAEYISWAIYTLQPGWPNEIDLDSRIVIRSVQVKVAALAGKDFTKINDDLDDLLQIATPEENFLSILIAYLYAGALNFDLPLSITMPRAFLLLELFVSHYDLFSNIFDQDLLDNLPNIIWAQGIKVTSFEEISLFLIKLSNLMEEEKRLLFSASLAPDACITLIDQSWIKEVEKPENERKWIKVLSDFELLEFIQVVKNNEMFQIGCTRARSVIYNDYLGESKKAIELLGNINEAENNDLNFIINYSKAIIYSDNNSIREAINFFYKAEAYAGEGFYHFRLDNTRRLAIEKSKNGEWEIASKLIIKSIKKFRKEEIKHFYKWDAIEMFGELAWVHWSNNRWSKACAALYGYVISLIQEVNDVDNPRYKEAFNKAGHALGWFLSIANFGFAPKHTSDGGDYANVSAGLFGISKIKIRDYVPPVGFSKTILLSQLARLLKRLGLPRMSWTAYKKSLDPDLLDNYKNGTDITITYCDMSILEFRYGEKNTSACYINNSIKYLAYGKKYPKSIIFGEQALDFSTIGAEDIKAAEINSLYLIFIPIFLNIIFSDLPTIKIEEKLNVLETIFTADTFLYRDEWKEIINYFKGLANWNNLSPRKEIEVFGHKRIYEIIKVIIESILPATRLNDSFSKQVSACTALIDYSSFAEPMLMDIGKGLHKFWSKVSKTQRFALYAPSEFERDLSKIPPNLGGVSIVKVLKRVSMALRIVIPKEFSERLDKLYTL